MIKKLLLHFNFIRDTLRTEPCTKKVLADKMLKEFGDKISYHYVFGEVKELVSLNKIKEVKYNNETQLLWLEKEVQFEYELSNNVIKLDKQYKQFITIPSKVRQMRLPLYVIAELKNKIVDLGEHIELILDINAVKSGNTWYKIQKE